MKTSNSLIKRLWLASALCLPLIVGVSAFTLNRAFVQSLDAAEEDALLAQVYALIALADLENRAMVLPSVSANPKLETHESGLYARVLDDKSKVIWRSKSLESSTIRFQMRVNHESGKPIFRSINTQAKEKGKESKFRSLSFDTLWDINGQDKHFTFEIFQSQREKRSEIRLYQRALIFWLGGMTVLLIVVQSVIVRWGLRPLSALASEIEDIEQGKKTELQYRYPKEIIPVARSLDKLLRSENAQRERYKNALANLAHSLKTPLAVIRTYLSSNERDQSIDDQISNMSAIVNHQLKRASAEVVSAYGPRTSVTKVANRICSALAKIYESLDMDYPAASESEADITAQIQEQDLMEVLGNIIENACKYGDKRVRVRVLRARDGIKISIEDDGSGVPDSIRQEILTRGARADTSKRGQGLGLAVAVDILSSYNGGLTIFSSELGGACFEVFLPTR